MIHDDEVCSHINCSDSPRPTRIGCHPGLLCVAEGENKEVPLHKSWSVGQSELTR